MNVSRSVNELALDRATLRYRVEVFRRPRDPRPAFTTAAIGVLDDVVATAHRGARWLGCRRVVVTRMTQVHAGVDVREAVLYTEDLPESERAR